MKLKATSLALLFCVVIGCVNCSASNSSGSSDSLDFSAVLDTISDKADNEPQGMLKAFGLKGKVKTLSIGEDDNFFNIAFDINGNYIKDPASSSGSVIINSGGGYYYLYLTIKDWKLVEMESSVVMVSTTSYKMTSYDSQNRPATAILNSEGEAMEEIINKKVKISYSGSDSHGNYTKIVFTDSNNRPVDAPFSTLDVKIEYWPDNASASDIPTQLTDKMAIDLIKKANVKQVSALSKDLKKVVDIVNDDRTLMSSGEDSYLTNIAIKIDKITIWDVADEARVIFYIAPIWDGKYNKEDLEDPENLFCADMIYENGAWRVDDICWDVEEFRGYYFPRMTYKEYHRNN